MTGPSRSWKHILVPALTAGCLSACDQSMVDQKKIEAYERGDVPRLPPAGTIARGDLERQKALAQRPPLTLALLKRGRERYRIFCTPCHGFTGQGDGMVVKRGFPSPPSFHIERLREIPARHFVAVMTRGHGLMYAYRDRVSPADRWAIAAYIRALQYSQRQKPADIPEAARQKFLQGRK